MDDFEAVYRACFHDVYRYLLSLCRDPHLAEDIVSETFLRAMESLDGFRGDCDVRVWLLRIARNCYYSRMRKQRRMVPLPQDAPDTPSPQPDPEQALADAEDAELVHRALHALDEPYREVFSLRVLGELPFAQIGSLFGKSANWACVVYHRARRKIQDALRQDTP